MRFGPVPVAQAEGAILAHSVTAGGRKLRKGLALQPEHIVQLTQAGLSEVIVAQLDTGDCHEDEAARNLAAALAPDAAAANLRVTEAFTGRVNLLADGPGVAVLDVAALERFNQVNPMITVATVPQHQQMGPGGMVATIKVISYAVPAEDVQRAAGLAQGAIRLARPVHQTAGLIVTDIPGGPSNEKGIAAIRGRVELLDMNLCDVQIVPHRVEALAEAVSQSDGDVLMILTGSATSDTEDVAPSAVRLAGGQVDRFGMPVDPGNLLFLGALQDRPVIGLPGCARSPALNGADWVLSRIACGIETRGADIAAMGVGGLLKEIPTRPQPRAKRKT
ncbi:MULTISPECIES: molybdopterin-binding protein [unclassified Ruegeria]|uniref:molybdopterin-binding protein n=1 Tax=unclassified Ruegeria TaxID=2625375 RepID=UPI00148931A2|nr:MULTISPECIES: molybdopterin-binding protein [unclassified Ruegeria]NOD75248.1 molybdopterin biosynthesis protein [Ruegeria sp. HKCCD4332]NOD87209.1 molybdopterin biosynthesis protein [Ruegeria sp. HKCCD4318]NOD91320.1 molybdopterin biosynthesis protein [Ruegeria sp. HKCCD4884]NOE12764.1 molybdopterin biosynthesis protein [Ruegeria sp. HKCCD4318-2]NOG09070.1 molybdopterin-binding protein [Ruegeria sp. HKCCD4315]